MVPMIYENRKEVHMEERLHVSSQNTQGYDIIYRDSFADLGAELAALGYGFEHKIAILTDSTVQGLYAEEVSEACRKITENVFVFSFPAGEESKNLNTVYDMYRNLIENRFDRHDLLVALGGGVTGDMTGFIAATYLRGVDFVQIPTTLLSQVDSSIGGKTGVDYEQYKNMIGAFKMPVLVYSNVSVLKTLDDRQFASGMGEVLKHGLIRNAKYYEWLLSNLYEIDERDSDVLKELVYESNLVKKAVVELDPYEKNERALLNFGHTIGHAIEKYMNFNLAHGECVALGSVAAAYISYQRGLLGKEEYYELRDMFVPFKLPISIDSIDPEEILKLTKSDKKMKSGKIRFVLLKKIGRAVLMDDVTDEEILEGIKEIYFDEQAND